MPALDRLGNLPAGWQEEYDRALDRAAFAAKRLPLVRVVIPSRPDHDRHAMERVDVMRHGKLRPSHKSEASKRIEEKMGASDALYFYAGRAHPDFGKAVLVIDDTSVPVEATPFGLGGLDCSGEGDRRHAPGSCVSPVAHSSESAQRAFYEGSRWGDLWRDEACRFLAAYFGHDLDAYFAVGAEGRPHRHDPEGIYADDTNRDWRSWVIEVRLAGEVDLSTVLREGRLLWWALDPQLEGVIEQESTTSGIPLHTLYPVYALLRAAPELRMESPTDGAECLFAMIDLEVQKRVFP